MQSVKKTEPQPDPRGRNAKRSTQIAEHFAY